MSVFDDLTYEEFDTLQFNVFDLYDAFDEYPASFYGEDILASTVGQHLPFLTILPRDDSVYSVFDMMQTLGMYRGIAAPDIPVTDPGFIFVFPNNKPHFAMVDNKSHFVMPINKPHFVMVGE